MKFTEFCYDGYTHNSIMTKQSLSDHAIMIDSVSKRYSMCGARIGCLVTKNKNVYNTALKFAQADCLHLLMHKSLAKQL